MSPTVGDDTLRALGIRGTTAHNDAEGIHGALENAVDAIGGSKIVGELLFGGDPIKAGKRVKACLNTSSEWKFAPEEVVLILQKACEKGEHEAMEYFARACGYEVRPIGTVDRDSVPGLLRLIQQDGSAMRQLLVKLVERVC